MNKRQAKRQRTKYRRFRWNSVWEYKKYLNELISPKMASILRDLILSDETPDWQPLKREMPIFTRCRRLGEKEKINE